jgi:RNA polymerase sigma-70 factor (ECF subfamily)
MADLDHILISRILDGDDKSIRQLIERYSSMAYTLAYKILNNKEEAEEAAQDALIKALNGLPRFREQSKFKTWLFRIVYNTAITYHRKHKTVAVAIDEHAESIDSGQTFVRTIEQTEISQILTEAIEKLKAEEASLITLFYFKEFNLDEIGEIMGIKSPNVKVKLFRARKKLASIITKDHRELLTLDV